MRLISAFVIGITLVAAATLPAGQIAFRELEIVRIKGALQRAEALSDDVAASIEGAFGA